MEALLPGQSRFLCDVTYFDPALGFDLAATAAEFRPSCEDPTALSVNFCLAGQGWASVSLAIWPDPDRTNIGEDSPKRQ